MRWHRARLPASEEVTICEGIPCTTASRTLVDLAGRVGEKSLRRLVEQAAVLRLLDVRGAPQLRAILAAWRSEGERFPRLRSGIEGRLLAAIVESGLPRPRCNVALQVDGNRLEVDLLWQDQGLVVETDGEKTHGTRAAFRRDRWRDQILAAAGYRTARVTWSQLEDEPTATVERIGRMLAAGTPPSITRGRS